MAFDLQAFRQTVLNDPLVYDVWSEKYRWRNADGSFNEDTVEATRERVVRAVYAQDPSSTALSEALFLVKNGYLVPAGRINAGAGLDRAVTLTNCFVNETVQDSMPGIHRAIAWAAFTMQQGGGVGTDWSTVRPAGAIVRRTGSVSSGVIPFMDEMNAMCATVTSAGTRRGAMMGTLRDDHPDLWNEEQFETATSFSGTTYLRAPSFISAKRLPSGPNPQRDRLNQFNVSVLVSDAFMAAVDRDDDWDLGFHVPRADGQHVAVYDKPFPYDEVNWDNEGNRTSASYGKGEPAPWYVYRRVKARRVWEDLMRSTYTYAEPGVIFIDRVNRHNNLNYCEEIRSTNPCGEQPLPPHGTCCLGSVNLAFMVENPFTSQARFNLPLFRQAVTAGVRLLDNVLTVTRFPLEAQRLESDAKRRIGLGVTGWADALAQLGVRYGSDEAVTRSKDVARLLKEFSYCASVTLAQERGRFPLFDEAILDSPNVKSLPPWLQGQIRQHGLRNGVLNTVAPNGTISMYIGNVGSGIEPFFSTATATRKVRQPDGSFKVYDSSYYAVRLYHAMHPDKNLPDYFVGAHEVDPTEHVLVQAAWQAHVDASISKTINCRAEMTFDEFESVYDDAYALGCKGCTTYRPDPASGRGSVLSEVEKAAETALNLLDDVEQGLVAAIETDNGIKLSKETLEAISTVATLVKELDEVRSRPDVVEGRTHKLKWPPTGESIYVTVNHVDGRPFEVFLKHADPALTEWTDALARMITGVFRREGDVRFVAEQLQQVGSTKGGSFLNGRYWPSQVAAIGGVLEREIAAGTCEICQTPVECRTSEYPCDLSGEFFDGRKRAETPIGYTAPNGGPCPKCHQHSLAHEEGCLKCVTCGYAACG